MSFDTISKGLSDRLQLCSLMLTHVETVEAANPYAIDDLTKSQKGIFFVQLYAALEYTVTNGVSTFLELLSSNSRTPKKYAPPLLSILLDSYFKALMNSGSKNAWKKRYDLLEHAFGEVVCEIDTSVFPSSAMNISYKEIQEVWFFLGIECDPLPTGFFPPILGEVKDHRNAIAHGRECANDIGGRYTTVQLRKKYSDMELLCNHIVSSLSKHYTDRFSK